MGFNNHYYCTGVPYTGSARDWDSGMGRIRTYIYADNLGEGAILDSLKCGHAIMTDGPVVVFNITNEHGETVIIGVYLGLSRDHWGK